MSAKEHSDDEAPESDSVEIAGNLEYVRKYSQEMGYDDGKVHGQADKTKTDETDEKKKFPTEQISQNEAREMWMKVNENKLTEENHVVEGVKQKM